MQQLIDLEIVADLPGEPRCGQRRGSDTNGAAAAHDREPLLRSIRRSRASPARRRRRQRERGARDARRDSLVQNRCSSKRPRSLVHQCRAADIGSRCDSRSTARVPTGQRVFRSSGTAGEPLSVALGGLSGARRSPADPRRRRAHEEHGAVRFAGGGYGWRFGDGHRAGHLRIGARDRRSRARCNTR